MNNRVALSTVLMMLLFLSACSLQRNWNYVPDLGPEEKLLLVPYDSNSKSVRDDQFPLYYFTANIFDKNKPTILFCAGGPGQIVIRGSSTFTGFLEKAGYNVVYFHLRGTGFSQFPQSNSYDEYLRTNLAIEDIERIREDFRIERWRAVVGVSYGTVLAQQYAGKYGPGGSAKKERLDRLILVAPLSFHGVRRMADATSLIKDSTDIQVDTLRKIYTYGLTDIKDYQQIISKQVETIMHRVDTKFDSVAFIIGNYERLLDMGGRNLLQESDLRYSLSFFKALRMLRNVGWLRSDFDKDQIKMQEAVGLIIVRELANRVPELNQFIGWEPKGLSYDMAAEIINLTESASSQRVYNVVSTYDGLDIEFLKAWLGNGETDVRTALRKSAGEVHSQLCAPSMPWEPCRDEVNSYVEKVGITGDKIRPWDPAKFRHSTPTLILKGGADPVSVGDKGDYIYYDALQGPRTVIQFPGIGHPVPDLALPPLIAKMPIEKDGPCKGNDLSFVGLVGFQHRTKDCLIYTFLAKEFDEFKVAPILDLIKTGFRDISQKMGADFGVEILHCPQHC